MKKQMSAWVDLYSDPKTGEVMWGIECDDPDMTFDGRFICVSPSGPNDAGKGDADRKRCSAVLEYMQGKRQVKRN